MISIQRLGPDLLGTALRLVGPAISLVTVPMLLHFTGADVYGTFALIVNTGTALNFLDIGRSSQVMSGPECMASRTVGVQIFRTTSAITLFLAAIGYLVSWTVKAQITPIEVLCIAAVAFGASLITAMSKLLARKGNFILGSSLPSIASGLVQLVWTILTLTCQISRPVVLQSGYALTYILLSVVVSSIVMRRLPAKSKPATAEAAQKRSQRSGFLFLQISAFLAYQCDTLIVAEQLSRSAAATYTVFARIVAIPVLLSGLFLQRIWVSTAETNLRHGELAALRAYWNSWQRQLTTALAIGIAAYFAVPIVIGTWVGNEYRPSAVATAIIAGWISLWLLNAPQSMVLNGLGLLKFQMATTVVMVPLNTILSIRFCASVGAVGPLLGSITAQLATTFLPSSLFLWVRYRRCITASARESA